MIFIPGWLIALITFPGVIVHEIAHRFFCDITKTPVYAICYFKLDNPTGFVIHAPVKEIKKSLLISMGPLIINTIICIIISFTAAFPIHILKSEKNIYLFYFLWWVGFSIGAHAIPSDSDIKSFVAVLMKKKGKDSFYPLFSCSLLSSLKFSIS